MVILVHLHWTNLEVQQGTNLFHDIQISHLDLETRTTTGVLLSETSFSLNDTRQPRYFDFSHTDLQKDTPMMGCLRSDLSLTKFR